MLVGVPPGKMARVFRVPDWDSIESRARMTNFIGPGFPPEYGGFLLCGHAAMVHTLE